MTLPRAGAIALVLLLVGAAAAAITVSSTSTLQTTVRDAPVHFSLGSGAAKERFVSNVTVTPNGTSFSASLTGRLGGDVNVKDVVRLVSASSATRTVELRGTQVDNVNVPIHTWTVRSGGATIATLDMRQNSPSATFTIAAGATYEMDLRVKVLRGITASEAQFTSSVWGAVS